MNRHKHKLLLNNLHINDFVPSCHQLTLHPPSLPNTISFSNPLYQTHKPSFSPSTFKASTDDRGAGVSASVATLEGPKSEQKEPGAFEPVPLAEENSNGVVASGGGVKVEVSKFENPRWISGTWDLKQFKKDEKTDWDVVIDDFSFITLGENL